MKMRKMQLALSAGALALSLALAGCGGGGGSANNTPTPPVETPKTQAEIDRDLERAANTAEDALGIATSKLMTLADDDKTDGSARMMAKKYSGMLDTESVDGNSKAAMDNAAMVLQARADLMSYIGMTETAITDLKTARDELPDGSDVAEINAAIKDAEDLVEDAQAVLDGKEGTEGTLAYYVKMVTGGLESDPQGTAKSIGERVAMAIAMALGPTTPEGGTVTNPNGAGTRVNTDGTTPREDTVGPVSADVKMANRAQLPSHDPMSMTWAALVGEAALMDRLINTRASEPADTHSVKVAAIDGMKVADVFGSDATLGEDDLPINAGVNGAETTTDTSATDMTNYMGIPGTVICGGTDCAAKDGKLTGSWYFTPTNPMHIYKKESDKAEANYVRDTMIATYGHWLQMVEVGGEMVAQVNTYASTSADVVGGETGSWDVDQNEKHLKDAEATYNGTAIGRSVHKITNEHGGLTDIQSGRFMADVMLTAKFGDNPRLGGTIDNFEGTDNPMAVDPNWTVKLVESAVTGGAASGMTEATGQDGTWSAQSYGVAPTDVKDMSMRPEGIFGNFNAHFTDGHVAGAYATRND